MKARALMRWPLRAVATLGFCNYLLNDSRELKKTKQITHFRALNDFFIGSPPAGLRRVSARPFFGRDQ